MKPTEAVALARYLPHGARCLTCGKPPEHTEVTSTMLGYRALFLCHGASEWFDIGPFDDLPATVERSKRLFARSVASHGVLGQAGRLLRAARPKPGHCEHRER